MKLQKHILLLLMMICCPKNNVYGFTDAYYDCLGPDAVDSGKMLKCIKEDQKVQLKQIYEDVEYLNKHISLPDNQQNLTAYINTWEKYSKNLCQYFSFAFDYIDGEKIASDEDSQYQYEHCREIEISAMQRRIEELKNLVNPDKESD